jgi:hypothetical protein
MKIVDRLEVDRSNRGAGQEVPAWRSRSPLSLVASSHFNARHRTMAARLVPESRPGAAQLIEQLRESGFCVMST